MKRRAFLALVAGCLGAALPAVASAALLWTLVATPLTTTVNVSTTFTLTATNLLLVDDLGCLEVDLPTSFVIESLGTPSASNGDDWSSSQSGSAVIVRSLSGGGRLEVGESVQFTIRARGTVAGVFSWPNHAHRQQDCSSTDQPGVPLAVTVLPAEVPTATPTPSPRPTSAPTVAPKPTPAPTAVATPRPPVDTATPTPSPSPTPTTTDPASASPERSASPAPSDRSGVAGPGPGQSGGAAGASTTLTLMANRGAGASVADVEVGAELIGLLDADYVWFVPAASVALPGLLVILFVGLQAAGALAWIPAMRRMEQERQTRGSQIPGS